MTSLKKLISEACPEYLRTFELPDIAVRGIECDSRKIEKDFLFVMIRGEKLDGRQFAEEAIRRGAAALVGDRQIFLSTTVPFILVPDSRLTAARLASVFHNYPDKKICTIGITGTNGKTTCSYLIEHLLQSLNKKAGVLGTVNYRYAGKMIPAVETTPGPLRIQSMLSEMVDHDCEYAVMEVSSHALSQNRVGGIDFETALFTNLTQDHLDYHKTMEAYFECKSRLFTHLSPGKTSVINIDDEWGSRLIQMVSSNVISYAVNHGDADLCACNIKFNIDGTYFDLVDGEGKIKVTSPLIGLHNVYNVLGTFGVIKALGFDLKKAADSLNGFQGVPGRLEALNMGQDFHLFVDYAHTPDGLENVLLSLRPYKKKKLFVVFGCGGERDKDKRPKMGRIASEHSDHVFVTSDNPRSEDPHTIAKEIQSGFTSDFKEFTIMLDRRKAIRQALLTARAGDIVLLAGKGHETTQVIGNQSLPFNDKEEAERVLSGR